MRRGLSRFVLGMALSASFLTGTASDALARVPQTPGPEPGSPEQMEYFADFCRHELQRPPTAAPHVGKAENVTSPGPGVALAGDVIDITISWDPADFDDTWIQKVLNCVAIDGVPVPELTDEERPAPNDGSYNRELVIPADIEGGRLLCQQGFVYGNLSRGGYSLISSPRADHHDDCGTATRPGGRRGSHPAAGSGSGAGAGQDPAPDGSARPPAAPRRRCGAGHGRTRRGRRCSPEARLARQLIACQCGGRLDGCPPHVKC
jgi:hypothetical protein